MNRTAVRWVIVGLLGTTSALAQTEPNPEQASKRAQAAMSELSGTLREALIAKLAADGPVAAVDFCATEAKTLTQQVSARTGVLLGRTSLRTRSPDNRPNDWQTTMLQQLAEQHQAGTPIAELSARSETEATLRVGKAIAVDGPCLMCHGPVGQMPKALSQTIAARYPGDQATGFSAGDLRGMIWAEVPMPEAASDKRLAIAMRPGDQQALKAQMRQHLETLQTVLSALAGSDWPRLADAATNFGPGRAAPGAHSFRDALPQSWFAFARPMHQAFNGIATEATTNQRQEVIVQKLAEATQQCTACHATYRITTLTEPES